MLLVSVVIPVYRAEQTPLDLHQYLSTATSDITPAREVADSLVQEAMVSSILPESAQDVRIAKVWKH